MPERPLTIVSNRGPAEFGRDERGDRIVHRGGGGLVTALSGLVSHRHALWIASAMTDEDVVVAERERRPGEIELDGISYDVQMVASNPTAYDRFYNVIANPILWFIQHYLWDLSNAPDIRQAEVDAWEQGYKVVNDDIAAAVIQAIDGQEHPVVMLHDYHLYTCPGADPAGAPGRLPPLLRPHPLVAGRLLAHPPQPLAGGDLPLDALQRHHRLPHHLLLPQLPQCCRELMELEVDFERMAVMYEGREVWVRAYPLSIDTQRLYRAAESSDVAFYEKELLRRRRDHLIIRVDRADLSKNVLRGFTAFDVFLEQHPEFREKVTFIAHLQPSRQDVPEYAEYLERIEALVAVVNHRHGTTDWMPIDLRIYENFHEAVARYKHFDLLMVNSPLRRDEPGRQGGAGGQHPRRSRDALREHRRPRGARRLHALGQSLRHPGAGGRDLPRADHGARGARAALPAPQGDHHRARPGRLGRRADGRHPSEAGAGGVR